ncbi:hypothetical protein Aci011_131 [Acinetobacter phage vB_AbaM_B09_Aci01-1]|uniref:Uncharacterized protein n=3 Tax=Saclayvirus TaxID=2733128 RepID=A0A386KK63_9CAUD|nr:hypothetical protein HOU29_gp050 [Acinetobacter phage vB_AbaM_B09_Aci01-1]YP_009813354.1 hypothetical protein HOU30_gp058 [Acinetobacter phage vB_AbaM_B09_Aci02-2]YP_009813982.1 hypothetical protein HOU35_gp049 [Acinetobacter phage vB_AbaM_B09_Aci05]QMP19036.1 hypothetical protein FKOIJHOC_00088 [Acinetobacter phage Ab_121]AYD82366.1 hypothetical protein Aci05_128 [Acinetobacter phage vB_AbaM_B09_Aci05]AYD85576.1 hypothetical protein Aci011_131 [Acinetobacter phage vB_AbaM_B09_Aci01-1]AYD8
MKVYRIEHPETGHGIFRTDWEDIRHNGFLSNLPDNLIWSYHDAFKRIKSYNCSVKHDTPTGESTGKQYAIAMAILYGDTESIQAKKHLTEQERSIIREDYLSGKRALCAAPSIEVMSDWIELEAIQFLQMTGFKLYEIDLKVRKSIHYVSDTQVVFFPRTVKSKKEICLSRLASRGV